MNKRQCMVGWALLLSVSAAVAGDDKEFRIGIEGHGRTEAADVGLPVFAGATPFQQSV